MKTLVNILLPVLAFFAFNSKCQAQCFYFEDFSNPAGWTQVGTLVEINNGELQYIDGAPDGVQRRVYKELDTPISNADLWTASFKFRPEEVGTYQGQPFPGHLLFSLTETTQDPWWDCPNSNCTGYPPGTQDALTVSYHAENPPDGTMNFRITVRTNSVRYDSPVLTYSELGDNIYIVLTKNENIYSLNIFSDPDHLFPVGNGPVTLSLFTLAELNYIQHGNAAGGYHLRELTGIIDDVCIAFNEEDCEITYGSFTYQGCVGDGSSFTIGNNVYDQYNRTGTEILVNEAGCDSIVTISLAYFEHSESELVYFGCEGDGYEVDVNGTSYNELNSYGTEYLINQYGCDSIVTVNLMFYPASTSEINYTGCHGDGFQIEVNGTLYWEGNPYGEEHILNSFGCDSVVTINLIFFPSENVEINYIGCQGDGYEIVVNGTTYWEGNPYGVEYLTETNRCGTIVTINLVFHPVVISEVNYNGCVGDGYEIEINGTIYWEENPVGEELMLTQYGCDSIILINLRFDTVLTEEINYIGCQGDGYQIEVNGTTYWEGNPTGEEYLVSQFGCDSIITINLVFNPHVYTAVNYVGCQGDGYQIEVNGTTYWEGNPHGEEYLQTQYGCDSIFIIDLVFYETAIQEITYLGCEGDGYAIEVNGNMYNESNPIGIEYIFNDIGCDSIIQINLDFEAATYYEENYVGCTGDGYFIEVNGNLYDEYNPAGIETLQNINGCDSIVTIELNFLESSSSDITYVGCKGDEYAVSVNGNNYNESNLSGTEILQNVNGCDSIITINLIFAESYVDTILYKGIHGDGYQIKVNGTLYNERNPRGVEIMETIYGCDSIIYIFLVFSKGKYGKDEDVTVGGFGLYPNPTRDLIHIDINYDAISKSEFLIRIYNFPGELIRNSVSNESSFTLNTIDFLESGTYYCEILTTTGKSLGVKKFIVTR